MSMTISTAYGARIEGIVVVMKRALAKANEARGINEGRFNA